MEDVKLTIGKENGLKRNLSIDVLRIFACLGVLIVHVTISTQTHSFLEEWSVGWFVNYILKITFSWSVPIFAMITGFLFLSPEKELHLKKLYGKNILRLVLSLVFWTLFYAITLHFPYYPFNGSNSNLWYVRVCIGLYMSMPILRAIASDDKLLSYCCWAWLAIRALCNIELFVEIPIKITNFMVTEYAGFCLWGCYLSRIQLNRKQLHIVYLVGLLVLLLTMLSFFLVKDDIRSCVSDIDPFFVCVAIFLFAIRHQPKFSMKLERLVTYVSGMTFGVYMVHSFVMIMIFDRLHQIFPNVLLLIPLSFLVTVVFSFLIILVIKQIPILKKWVV